MRNPIIVALDVPTAAAALELVTQLSPSVGGFKVGAALFTGAGPDIVHRIRERGALVFLDLKFHDIPNTVARAVATATRLDTQMLTVHASGGFEMLQAAERAAQETARQLDRPPPLVLGVTVLTSLDAAALREVGLNVNVEDQVRRLAEVSIKAGLRGLVCSPLEAAQLRQAVPPATQLVTPGVRVGHERTDDQKRTLTPREAMAAGADWLVVGRPICAAPDPRAAAQRIWESLN